MSRIVELLSKAYADEWIAYSQYWVGAKLASDRATGEFLEHANDERRHADAIFSRLVQLGAQPAGDPAQWKPLTGCPFVDPGPGTDKMIEQNIASERCAIKAYRELLAEAKSDQETSAMVTRILEDEMEHERDLRELLEGTKTASADIPLSKRAVATELLPISKWAQDPVRRTAESILKIINFILFRVPQKDKNRYLQRIRGKIIRIPTGQMSQKKMPQSAAIGQAIALAKNILTGLNPFFVKRVVDELANMMVLQAPPRKRPMPRPPRGRI